MTHLFSKRIIMSGLALVTLITAQASADEFHHINTLAGRIERKSNRVVNLATRYRETPEYTHLIADAAEVSRLASHIRAIVRFHRSLASIEAELAQLDAQFCHLETVFERVEANAACGNGHIRGSTRPMHNLLNSIEKDIAHMRTDIESLRAPAVAPCYPPPVVAPTPRYRTGYPYSQSWYSGGQYPQPWYQGARYSGRGYGGRNGLSFSIGGGSSRITFRF